MTESSSCTPSGGGSYCHRWQLRFYSGAGCSYSINHAIDEREVVIYKKNGSTYSLYTGAAATVTSNPQVGTINNGSTGWFDVSFSFTPTETGTYRLFFRLKDQYNSVIPDLPSCSSNPSAGNYNCRIWKEITVNSVPTTRNLTYNPSYNSLTVTGTNIDLSLRVINDGNTSAGSSSRVGYYLSTNTTITVSDNYLGDDYVSNLSAGGSSPESFSMDVGSTSIPAGTYYVGYIIDYQNDVVESDESRADNTYAWSSSQRVTIPPPVSGNHDITVTGTSIEDNTVDPGQENILAACYQNYTGDATTDFQPDLYYLWNETCSLSGATTLYDLDYSTIGDDPSDYESQDITIPTDALTGTHYVVFSGDHNDEVPETNENNNIQCEAVTVNHVADVTIRNESIDKINVDPGDIVDIRCRQYYIGNSRLDIDMFVRFYLSVDNVFDDGTDIYLGEERSRLSWGDEYDNEDIKYTIPAGTTPGIYYIIFVGDYTDVVAETDENNNTASIQFTINQPCVAPSAEFTLSSSEINQGESVNFVDISTGSTITNRSWSFEGGSPSSSTSQNPSGVTFSEPGYYDIELSVTNGCGSNSITKKLKVLPNGDSPVTVAEVRGNDYPKGTGGDPVNLATGEYMWGQEDLTLTGIGGQYSWRRYYRSLGGYDGPMGQNWYHNYDISLTVESQKWTVRMSDGSETYHIPYENGSSLPLHIFSTDTMYTDGASYTLEKANGTKYGFNLSGEIETITNRNNQSISFTHAGGYLSSITFPGGRSISLTYDVNNRIDYIDDSAGRRVDYSYDVNGNCIAAQNVDGNSTLYGYDGSHQMTTITDPNGNVILTNTYTVGKVTRQEDAIGGVYLFAYDTPVAGATTLTNPLNDTQVYYHDDKYRLVQLTDELGFDRFFTYDEESNQVTQFTNEKGNSLNFQVDGNGNITQFTDALNNTSSSIYDDDNLPTQVTDALSRVTSIAYDSQGNPNTITYPNTATFQSGFNSNGQLTSQTDPNGNVSSFTYDVEGDLTTITTTTGDITLTTDNIGRVQMVTDRNGKQIQLVRDNYGNVTEVTYPTGDKTYSTYDKNGNLVSYTDRKGSVTAFVYDKRDRLTTITDALGNASTLIYDAMDRLTQLTDANGNVTTYVYDAKGRLSSYTNDLGTYSFGYDGVGNRTSVTDARGNVTTILYDAMNRPVGITDALGNMTVVEYNAVGQPISITNANNQKTTYSYNTMGWLVSVLDANTGTTTFTYDNGGNMLTYTDANGHEVAMTYNNQNRVASKTFPGNYQYSFTYDNEGNPKTYTDPVGTVTTVNYDDLYNISSLNFSNGVSYAFTYDQEGLMETMTNAQGTTSLERNALGWITKMTDPFGNVIGKEYDKVGNVTATAYPGEDTVRTTYNSVNLPITISDWLGNSSTRSYDENGSLTGISNSNGTSTTITRDALQRISSYTNFYPDNSIINQHNLIYDNIGQIIQESQILPLYPDLTDTTMTFSYRNDDALTSGFGGSYVNDDNGARISSTINATTYTYNWAENDLLTQYTHDGTTTTNHYNPLRQRIRRIRGSDETRYALDISGDLSQIIQAQDGIGGLKYSNVFAPDGLAWQIDGSDEAKFFHFSYIGHTVGLTDESGSVTDSYASDPFGGFSRHQGTSTQPFTYLGKYGVENEGNNQYHIRARDYDANAGRFLCKDVYPASMAYPTTINRYSYANNGPVNFMDITGFFFEEVIGYETKEQIFQYLEKQECEDLNKRPDRNGFVTMNEGISWAKSNEGARYNPTACNTLYIDASKLDFGSLSTQDFAETNTAEPHNLMNYVNLFSWKSVHTTYALGRANFELLDRSTGEIKVVNDFHLKEDEDRATDYDWNKGGEENNRSSLINANRWFSSLNDNHGFRVYYYGIGKINVTNTFQYRFPFYLPNYGQGTVYEL